LFKTKRMKGVHRVPGEIARVNGVE
jgi:hypothetical protein